MKHEDQAHQEKSNSAYRDLGIMTIIHIAVMYVAMFAMIDRAGYFYNNTNMFYMALLMAAPVTLIMLVSMRHMYQNAKVNIALGLACALLAAGSYYAIRAQAGVGDAQFIRAMIPHHSGAILMCREAAIGDLELTQLCKGIIDSQQQEIDQMEAILKRL